MIHPPNTFHIHLKTCSSYNASRPKLQNIFTWRPQLYSKFSKNINCMEKRRAFLCRLFPQIISKTLHSMRRYCCFCHTRTRVRHVVTTDRMTTVSPHMTPVHTKIRYHPENFKKEKFIHTPTQDGNLQSLLLSFTGRVKVKQSLHRPWGFQEVEVPRFIDNRHMQVVRMSALRTGRLYLPGNIPGTRFCYRLSRPQGHRAAGRIKSMTNSNDTIENRNRDLPACSALPQPTAVPTAPLQEDSSLNIAPCINSVFTGIVWFLIQTAVTCLNGITRLLCAVKMGVCSVLYYLQLHSFHRVKCTTDPSFHTHIPVLDVQSLAHVTLSNSSSWKPPLNQLSVIKFTELTPFKPSSFDVDCHVNNQNFYRGADKSLARPGRKQATATEYFDVHISYLS